MGCVKSAAFSVADILRDHVRTLFLDGDRARAAAHILACRTGRLGGHRTFCDRCGEIHYGYHSCRDRHCPTCGHLDQALWAEAQARHLLPVAYFHLVFTVPASLRPFFAGVGRELALKALFAAVSETLGDVAARQGITLGILAVLHTWSQKLTFHPHIHCLVIGGGLTASGFIHRRRFLLPRKVLQIVFKAKLLEKLQVLHREGGVQVGRHSGYELLRDASRPDWQIDIRRPLHGPRQVIDYFARYTRRIAISNRRIQSYDGQNVVFRWRDRAHGNRVKLAQLDAQTFCRRFLQHVLPPGFVRIRRYGLLSNRLREGAIQRCRELLDADPPPPPTPESRAAACLRIFGRDPGLCPTCKIGRLVMLDRWYVSPAPTLAQVVAARPLPKPP
jgi:hypothetical protein